ncbi:MAG: hypothetical protein QXY76_01100 [Nitrososphaeria archaeon]
MIFKVKSLEDLAKMIVASKTTELMQYYGGIFVTGVGQTRTYFTFGDPDDTSDFLNIFFTEDENVGEKFLKFSTAGGKKLISPSKGIEGTDVYIPLIYLDEKSDFRGFPKDTPLIVRMQTFEDLLRSTLGWPIIKRAFVLYNWKHYDKHVYTIKLVQRIFDRTRRIYFTYLSDNEIGGGRFVGYRVSAVEEWKLTDDLLEPKWVYFPIVKLEEGFEELSRNLASRDSF